MILQLIILGLSGLLLYLNFLDGLYASNASKQKLNDRFKNWWAGVSGFPKAQVALEFVKKINEYIDAYFGAGYFSMRLLKRAFRLSTTILIIALVFLGLRKDVPFGAYPWRAYSASIETIRGVTDLMMNTNNYADIRTYDLQQLASSVNAETNQILLNVNSNLLLFTRETNRFLDMRSMGRLGGGLHISYDRVFGMIDTNHPDTNGFGNVVTNTNPRDDLIRDMRHLRKIAEDHDKYYYKALYTAVFYVCLIVANFTMFVFALAFGRTILKEIAASGRLLTTGSLVFFNAFCILISGGLFLFILTIFAIPVFWIAVPSLLYLASDSIPSFIYFMVPGTLFLFFVVGKAALAVLAISLLPSLIALQIGVIAFCLVKCQNFTYKCIAGFVESLSTRNIYITYILIVGLLLGFIDLVVKVYQVFFGAGQ